MEMTIKGSREDDSEVENRTMANCLMLLSRVGKSGDRVYDCKTCHREFNSFQALCGHRAAHKPKPKTRGCPICGLMFAFGHALGGHMKRQRDCDCDDYVSGRPEVLPPGKRGLWDLNLTPYENDLKLWTSSLQTTFVT